MKQEGFTLIELLVVIAIIAILAVLALIAYNKFIKVAECGGNKEQHRKVVNMAKETYGFCSLNGSTYMNSPPGLTCRSNPRSGMIKISGDGYTTKCVKKWDCKSDWLNRRQTAGLSSGYFFDHVRAEFVDGTKFRNDQIHNFESKSNHERRIGLTNIRGVPPYGKANQQLRISTILGNDCDSNSHFISNNITWP